MATKPATVPSIWSPGANYTTGPFVGQPTKVIPAGAVALDGHRPGSADPTPGEYVNYQDHWTTTWVVNWLSQGSATAVGNTHIVETDADGRTELVGLDLTDAVDRVLCNWSASNTLIPAVLLDSGGGGGVQVRDPSGAAFIGVKSAGASGTGVLVFDDPAATAIGADISLAGTGQLATMVASGLTTDGVYIESVNRTPLRLNCIGSGASINISTKAPPASPVAGDIVNDSIANQLKFWNSVGNERVVWATNKGISRAIFTLPGQVNNASVAAPLVLISQFYPFDGGKRYTINARFKVGQYLGSTKFPTQLLSIGATNAPDNGISLPLFHPGAGYLERDVFMMTWDFVPGATATLQVLLRLGDSGAGAGNINYGFASVSILGAFD